MIEFTADCGHIIKADKARAGAIVQCAYCGREAEVPRPADPDFLFEEVDLDELAKTEGSTPLGIGPDAEAVAEPVAERPPRSSATVLAAGGTIVGLIVLIAVGYVIIDSVSSRQNQPTGPTAVVPGSHLTGAAPDNDLPEDGHAATARPGDPATETPTHDSARLPQDRVTLPDNSSGADPRDATPDASEEILQEAERLRSLLTTGVVVAAQDWARFLFGGSSHSTWVGADADSRIALIEVMPDSYAAQLSAALGNTMLQDDDLNVRLALLEMIVVGRGPTALAFIEQRLSMLDDDTSMTAVERQVEQSQLQAARRRLAPKPARRTRNPWDR